MEDVAPLEDSISNTQTTHCKSGFSAITNDDVYKDEDRYQPLGEVIKVRANFIIIQRQNGSGNFQNIPEHIQFLNEWVSRCNEVLGSTWWSNNSSCHPPASDARVEIVPNWVFLPDPSQNEYYWNYNNKNTSWGCQSQSNWWLNGLDQLINSDPTIP